MRTLFLISGVLLLHSFLSLQFYPMLCHHLHLLLLQSLYLPKLQFSKTAELSLIRCTLFFDLECAFSQKAKAIQRMLCFLSVMIYSPVQPTVQCVEAFFLPYIWTSFLFIYSRNINLVPIIPPWSEAKFPYFEIVALSTKIYIINYHILIFVLFL